jgi:hypothetical protein
MLSMCMYSEYMHLHNVCMPMYLNTYVYTCLYTNNHTYVYPTPLTLLITSTKDPKVNQVDHPWPLQLPGNQFLMSKKVRMVMMIS